MSDTLGSLPTVFRDFTSQRHAFLQKVLQRYPAAEHGDLDNELETAPVPLRPIVLSDWSRNPQPVLAEIADAFYGEHGAAAFSVGAGVGRKAGRHPLFALMDELALLLPVQFSVDHPMEQHPEAVSRFGPPDGTLKIYDLPIPADVDKYREQAETSELFAAHNDGLGYGGAVVAAVLVLDSAPAWGGFTCFQNLLRLAPYIERADPEGFESLFLPDAITALRPRGKGAIRVSSPVFFLNARHEPQTFFRISSGEYVITWRQDLAPLRRMRKLLLRLAQPFAPASTFVHLMTPGDGVLINNTAIVHSRTPFQNGAGPGRVLARKWFVASADETAYKHVPGMAVASEYADLFPDWFGEDRLTGEWHYDARLGENLRVAP